MNDRAVVNKGSGLFHSVVLTASSVHYLTPPFDLPHVDEQAGYADAG
jgi:hypothetical protein